jgi:hypothetical protein
MRLRCKEYGRLESVLVRFANTEGHVNPVALTEIRGFGAPSLREHRPFYPTLECGLFVAIRIPSCRFCVPTAAERVGLRPGQTMTNRAAFL